MFSQSGAEEESFETMAELQSQPQLWVLQENPDFLLPLAMYPPGFNTNGFNLIEASALEVAEYNQEQLGEESELSGGGVAAGISNGGCDCPSMGFFRVWHIPDWNFDITNYTYDGSWFLPIDFKDYRDRVDNVQVLINGEVSPYAEFMTYGSETNWGIGFDFDL